MKSSMKDEGREEARIQVPPFPQSILASSTGTWKEEDEGRRKRCNRRDERRQLDGSPGAISVILDGS